MPSETLSGASTQYANEFLLEVRHLSVDYHIDSEAPRCAINRLSFGISPGEVVGVLGESGSGKSTLAHALLGLLPRNARISGGSVLFRGLDLLRLPQDERRHLRGAEMAFVFQEPGTALNPVMRAGDQISEVIRAHRNCGRRDRRAAVDELLREAQLAEVEQVYPAYPHELSGGQQQRVVIAQAVACKPALVIADEPTSALDVTTQAEVLAYLRKLKMRLDMAIMLITHDPTTLVGLADRVLVLHKGELVEENTFTKICERPGHAYTRSMFASIPSAAAKISGVGAEKQQELLIARRVSKKYPNKRWFAAPENRTVQALSDVSLELRAGSTTGLVGESGSGKSTLARCLAAMEKPDSGEVWIEGRSLFALSSRELRERRRAVQLLFQNSAAALNPWLTLEQIVAEPFTIRGLPLRERREQAVALIQEVGLPVSHRQYRPTELSGGQRQRLAIARALAARPRVLILDEALSGLDLPVQSQMIELLRKLQASLALAYLFITHDLRMAAHISDEIAVMHAGSIVEFGPAFDLFSNPVRPQTRNLLNAIARLPPRPAEA
jgi:peptide/nickel transport system ATP-binding protein